MEEVPLTEDEDCISDNSSAIRWPGVRATTVTRTAQAAVLVESRWWPTWHAIPRRGTAIIPSFAPVHAPVQ
jgi:hypothetical protein